MGLPRRLPAAPGGSCFRPGEGSCGAQGSSRPLEGESWEGTCEVGREQARWALGNEESSGCALQPASPPPPSSKWRWGTPGQGCDCRGQPAVPWPVALAGGGATACHGPDPPAPAHLRRGKETPDEENQERTVKTRPCLLLQGPRSPEVAARARRSRGGGGFGRPFPRGTPQGRQSLALSTASPAAASQPRLACPRRTGGASRDPHPRGPPARCSTPERQMVLPDLGEGTDLSRGREGGGDTRLRHY